jgi:predicted nucleic acid-binding Zn ribbon protein
MEEIGKILPKVLKPQLARQEPPVVEVLAPLWTRVAGKALAKECWPVAFSGGTLTLATEDGDWAEPLRQMAEEIRMHVNKFLGKPVVERLKILRVRKLDRSDRAQWRPENPPVSRPNRKRRPVQGFGMAVDRAQVTGQSGAKYSGRKHGKVH